MKGKTAGILTTGALALLALNAHAETDRSGGLASRGRYLVEFGQCNDCHTPKVVVNGQLVQDQSRRLSGHPHDAPVPQVPAGLIDPSKGWGGLFTADATVWAGPWGVSFTANLTPDRDTGLGRWTEQDFIHAMQCGNHNGEPILPPMPWPDVGRLRTQDLRAIYAYLRSIPPIHNEVPENIVAPNAPPNPPAGPNCKAR